MAPRSLPYEIRQQIYELGQQKPRISNRKIAEMLGINPTSVNNYRGERPTLDQPAQQEGRIDQYAAFHRERFLELFERYQKWIGDTGKPPVAPKTNKSSRKRILAINDVHAPFHNEEALAQAIRDARGYDECWVVGDLLDLFNFSRYEKTKRPFSPVEEFQSGQAIIRTLAEAFPVVRVMHGNHDDRFVKQLVRWNIPPEILEFFKMMHPDFLSPLSRMVSDYKNVQMLAPKQIDFASYPFIHQIGDCVLSHAERYSKVPGKTPADVLDAIKKKLEPMGIVEDFKILGQAHTHCAGKVWGDYGVVTIEMGCLSRTPDYDGNPRLMGRKPIIGYTVFVQENGITDINASNFIQLG